MRVPKRACIKTSSDYPRFEVRFRNKEELEAVANTVEEVLDFLNKKLKENEKPFSKKEVVSLLIEEGAKAVKRK